VVLDFLAGLYERWLGRIIPTRFALFGTVGALGVVVHMAVVAPLYKLLGVPFTIAQATAAVVAMTFNFWLNNLLTYRDQKLAGGQALLFGWAKFCAACAIGAFANVAVAAMLNDNGVHWYAAAMIGVAVASVWNYALSSKFVWGRFK
jgi:dolichol-phosphate mannosyltransferase